MNQFGPAASSFAPLEAGGSVPAHLPDPPARGLVDELEELRPALEHDRLGARGVVQRRVRQRDPADGVLAQPVVVARRRSAARRRRRSGWPSGRAGAPTRARAARPWRGRRPPSGSWSSAPRRARRAWRRCARKSRASAWKASRVLGSPCASATARTAGSHCRYSSADADDRQREHRHALADARARARDGPASTPSRSAFCPNGDGTTNAPTSTPRYSSPPAHSVRRPGREQRDAGGGDARASARTRSPRSGRSRPRGTADTARSPPASVGSPSHSGRARAPAGRRRSASPPRRASGTRPRPGWRASSPAPSTPREHAPAATRAADHAPTPSAIPSRNGIRPIATLESTPAVNSHAAIAPAVGDGAAARASGANSATAATAETTPTQRGPDRGRQRREQQRVARARDARRTTARSRPSAPRAGTATRDRNARPCRRSPAGRSGRPRRPARNPAPAREGARTRAAWRSRR